MKLTAALLTTLFAAIAFAGPGAVAGETHDHLYVSGPLGLPSFWCEGGTTRGYAPQGSPNDYGAIDPADPDETELTIEGWATSGEPECVPGDSMALAAGDPDANNALGAIAQRVDDYLGGMIVATPQDDNFDGTFIDAYNYEIDGFVFSCGALNVPVDPDLEAHHQTPDSDPEYYEWIYVETVWADTDTTETCFGSTGRLTTILSA